MVLASFSQFKDERCLEDEDKSIELTFLNLVDVRHFTKWSWLMRRLKSYEKWIIHSVFIMNLILLHNCWTTETLSQTNQSPVSYHTSSFKTKLVYNNELDLSWTNVCMQLFLIHYRNTNSALQRLRLKKIL